MKFKYSSLRMKILDNYFAKRQTVQYDQSSDQEGFEASNAQLPLWYLVVPESRNEIAVNDDSKAVSSGRITAKFNFVSEQLAESIHLKH